MPVPGRLAGLLAAAIAAAVAATVASPTATANASPAVPSSTAEARVAGSGPPATTDLRFATFNVCKVTCDGRFTWERRRKAVVNTVREAAPDVLGVQEATIEYTEDGAPQYLDLAWRLGDIGYDIANPAAEDTDMPCTRGTHIFYRPGRIEPAVIHGPADDLSAGLESLQGSTSPTAWGPIRDRCFAWAYLRDRNSGGVFLAVSAHLAVEKNPRGEQVRRSSAKALTDWATAQNASLGVEGLPVVLMADLNSDRRRQPYGAQHVLAASGFRDSFAAPRRLNASVTTSNHFNRNDGWPAKPISAGASPERIDYVLVKHGLNPLRYRVFVRTKRSGRFDPRYRASDHNMVIGVWRLPVVVW